MKESKNIIKININRSETIYEFSEIMSLLIILIIISLFIGLGYYLGITQ